MTEQELHEKHGRVYSTEDLQIYFEVEGFGAPYVVVKRKTDGQRGSLQFQHMPRWYFDFRPV